MAVQELWDFPPKPFLQQVLNHCPKAGATYFFLWEKKDKHNRLLLTKEDISFKHPNAFRNDLRQLVNEGLISYTELSGRIAIEMVDWEMFEDE